MAKQYTIVNQEDGNDTFPVKANSLADAAFLALSILGWAVVDNSEDDDEEWPEDNDQLLNNGEEICGLRSLTRLKLEIIGISFLL